MFRCTNQRHGAIAAQQADKWVQIVPGGNGIENKVKTIGMLCHLAGIFRDHHFVCTEALTIVDF